MKTGSGPYPFPAVAVPARHLVALTAVVIVFMAHRAAGTVIDEGGVFLLLSISVVLANLVADLVYGLLDPRVRT